MSYFLLPSLSKMAKRVQKQGKSMEKILYHHGLIKLIVMHELQKQNFSWNHFLFNNDFEVMEENSREEEIFIISDNEEEVNIPTVKSSNQPVERIKIRSMIRREEELQQKDKIFYTYERKSRKHPRARRG